jgi:hypothetical protein
MRSPAPPRKSTTNPGMLREKMHKIEFVGGVFSTTYNSKRNRDIYPTYAMYC